MWRNASIVTLIRLHLISSLRGAVPRHGHAKALPALLRTGHWERGRHDVATITCFLLADGVQIQ